MEENKSSSLLVNDLVKENTDSNKELNTNNIVVENTEKKQEATNSNAELCFEPSTELLNKIKKQIEVCNSIQHGRSMSPK